MTTDRWHKGLAHIAQRRLEYTPAQLAAYAEITDKALALFDLPPGRLLDVGCGEGTMRLILPKGTQYVGTDAVAIVAPDFDFHMALAEHLPFEAASFDAVLCYSVLQHVEDVPGALQEMRRVLKPGGVLGLLVNVEDPNPIFMHYWNREQAVALVRMTGFLVQMCQVISGVHLAVRAVK